MKDQIEPAEPVEVELPGLSDHLRKFYGNEVDLAKSLTDPQTCPKGGEHEWGTDGVHNNEFYKKCFISKELEQCLVKKIQPMNGIKRRDK